MEITVVVAMFLVCLIPTGICLVRTYSNADMIDNTRRDLRDVWRGVNDNTRDISKLKKQSQKPKKYKVFRGAQAVEIEADECLTDMDWIYFYKGGEIIDQFKESDVERVQEL